MHSNARTRAFERDGLGRRLAPFVAMTPIVFAWAAVATPREGVPYLVGALALAVGLPLVAALVRWDRLPHWAEAIPPLASLPAVLLLNLGAGDSTNSYAPLVMLPVFWIALYGGRYALGLAAVISFCVVASSGLLAPNPDAEAELRRGTLWGLIALSVGLTTQRVVQRQRENEARIRGIIDSAQEAFVSMNEHGLIEEWNPEAERIFGWPAREAVGRNLADTIIPKALRADHEQGLRTFLETGEGPVLRRRLELVACRRGEGEFPVELTITPLRTGDDHWMFHAFLRDISERKAAEHELRRSEASLRDAVAEQERLNEELRRADELKSHFLAMASHELRTPLTAIRGFSTTMRTRWDSIADDEKRRFVEIIDDQGERLGRLVTDLLTLSRIESGKLGVRSGAADVGAAIATAVEAAGADIEVDVDCPPGLRVAADQDHLVQILLNLLTNSIKYGQPPYRVEAWTHDDLVEIRIIDHGPGVPEEFMPMLFEKFARANHTAEKEGSGLGLSIVRSLAEAQGGSVDYEPVRPRGACFVLRFSRADRRR